MRWFFTGIMWMALTIASTPLAAQNTEHDSLHSLSVTDWRFRKIVGFNTTPLLAQLIPFNRSNPREVGPYLMRFKRYKPNGRAFRFSMGINMNFTNDDNEIGVNFGFGRERRRGFAQRWVYTRGFDFNILLGNINLPGQSTANGVILGCGPLWGLEYALAPHITVGTETALVMGLSLSDFGLNLSFQIIPPVALFVHYYL